MISNIKEMIMDIKKDNSLFIEYFKGKKLGSYVNKIYPTKVKDLLLNYGSYIKKSVNSSIKKEWEEILKEIKSRLQLRDD